MNDKQEAIRKNFLVNRNETGKECVFYPETGKRYYIEYIEPRGFRSDWGDINPSTKKLEGTYGSKYKGSINEEESVITEENGFENIQAGSGSPYWAIDKLHNEWKKENGFK